MQDDNIMKMSEMADTAIKDVPTLNILLCYLLYKIDKPVEVEQLYEISVSTGLINYFYYQDSIHFLLESGSIEISNNDDGTSSYILLEKGKECAKELKKYAPKAYRDKLVLAALKYLARVRYEQEIKLEYIPAENGYYTRVRCVDAQCDLMDLKLFAPDRRQAELLGEKIMLNPTEFYAKVIELALSNEEVSYDLSDN